MGSNSWTEFLSQHECVTFNFEGQQSPLKVGALRQVKGVEPVRLFKHLTPECKPVAAERRWYSRPDHDFIEAQISDLLKDDIIEPSISPWRAQIVVAKSENHKKRLCVGYRQTVNKFSLLDAYPLPSMQLLDAYPLPYFHTSILVVSDK